MPAIQGPAAAAQSGSPPTFQVDPSPNAFYAYEVATQPALFDQNRQGAARRPENFYASWQDGGLSAAPTVHLPAEVWDRLKAANRLYYRLWSSESRDEWRNALPTTPDEQAVDAPFVQLVHLLLGGVLNEAQAPVAAIWSTAMQQDALRTMMRAGECQALIGWHMFSPKRPVDPRMGEWIVVATTAPAASDAPIQSSLVRLAVQPLAVKAAHAFQGSPTPLNRNDVLDRLNRTDWLLSAEQLRRVGNFWVAADLRPPPGADAGTAIVHARTGQLLYQATTKWQGAGEVLIPRSP